MRIWAFFLVFIILSCSSQKDKIFVPEFQADFYDQALLRIDAQLDNDGSNMKLLEQKMYYCERLEWPVSCIEAIDEMKRQKGITSQLLDQYVTYYLKHGRYQKLLAVLDQWADEFGANRKYLKSKILALSALERKDDALALLRNYMISKTSKQDIEFAASQYLVLEDTLFSAYYLHKLQVIDSVHPLVMDHFGYLMIDLGYPEKGFPVLERYRKNHPDNFEFSQQLSKIYFDQGMLQQSRNTLKHFVADDTVIFTLADLYLQDQMWDSAHYYVDIIIDRDSLNRKAWWKKARMYEDRGWLSASLNYYNHLTYLNSQDSLALERAAIVRRKIAYLQRLKFEENKIPVPIIESKKLRITNE